MKRTLYIYIILFLLIKFPAFSQPGVTKEKLFFFGENIQAFNYLYPQEKVYLHFDNTGYFLGETIWFKAYLISTGQNQPTGLSRILYVELLTPSGEVKDSKKLKIEDGQCHGEFTLPHTMPPGFYEIRAYTRYMLNFGDDCLFSRVFPIYRSEEMDEIDPKANTEIDKRSPFIDKMRKPLEKVKNLKVSFYPEGGHTIQGLTSKVAFKVTDENGQSVDVECIYKDEDKKEIRFNTLHKGMGSFECTPSKKPQQMVVVKDKKMYKFKLPNSLTSGYVLNLLRQETQTLTLLLQRTKDIEPENLGLVISFHGQVQSFHYIYSAEQKTNYNLDISDLPSGVNRLTLFNSQGQILSDRLFFVNRKADKGSIDVSSDKAVYQAFEKVNMNFRVFDNQGNPKEACFSVAIRDAGKEMKTLYSDNLYTNLLLGSELKGYIENPAYYLESDDLQHAEALDLLMLVQGWRRYFQGITGLESFKAAHYMEKEILVKGRILSLKKKEPMGGINVTANIYLNDNILSGSYTTGSDGEFVFSFETEFKGMCFIELLTDSNQTPINTLITLDRQFLPSAKTYSFEEIVAPKRIDGIFSGSDQPDSIPALEKMQYLSEILVSGRRIKPDIAYNVEKEFNYFIDNGLDPPYNNTMWDYMEYRDKNFNMGNPNPGISNLAALTAGVRYEKARKAIPAISYNGAQGAGIYYEKKGIWENLDARPDISRIPLDEIEKITVSFEGTKRREAKDIMPDWDKAGLAGIFVYPYEAPIRKQTGYRATRLEGYSSSEAFYSPDYQKTTPIPGEIDYRRTLYWCPDVKTDSLGQAGVVFYNNNSCKKMSVSAEGLTKDGIPVISD
ncbi:hypothetical protein FACS189426_20270 [Bacteroidia bacterium]|nr:hypothetical protein FACS189426_20270 [Bacteroidia bacterium]